MKTDGDTRSGRGRGPCESAPSKRLRRTYSPRSPEPTTIRLPLPAPRLLAALTLATAVAGCGTEPDAASLQGKWGGQQVAFTVTGMRATLKLACAEGTLPAPARPDAEGRFRTAGEVHNHWGSTPATVEGQLQDGQLALRVLLSGTSTEYRLARGREGSFEGAVCLQ